MISVSKGALIFALSFLPTTMVGCLPDSTRGKNDETAPGYVRATEQSSAEWKTPGEDPDGWLLAFIDVETTGLVPGFHELIDLGVVMSDLEGNQLDELFLRIQPQHPERLTEGARRVNGFDADRWRQLDALPPAAAVERLKSFHREVAGDRQVLLVAFNSPFDTAFLDHLFRTQDSSWRTLYHYFVLDLPSMAWAKGYRDLTGQALAKRLGVADEPHVPELHTGFTGARFNLRIYRALRAGPPPG